MGVINVLSINMTSLCLNSFQTFLTSHNFTQCFSYQTIITNFINFIDVAAYCCSYVVFFTMFVVHFLSHDGCCQQNRRRLPFRSTWSHLLLLEVRVLNVSHTFCRLCVFRTNATLIMDGYFCMDVKRKANQTCSVSTFTNS